MPRYRATVNLLEADRDSRQEKYTEASIRVGLVGARSHTPAPSDFSIPVSPADTRYPDPEPTVGTTLRVWVPVPTDIKHLPAIFLRFSNGLAATFSRLNDDDYASIQKFLALHDGPLHDALAKAKAFHNKLIQNL